MVLQKLLRSRKFWLAVIATAQTILFQFVPDFPMNVWLSIDALLGVVIVTIAIEDAAEKFNGYHRYFDDGAQYVREIVSDD